MHRTTLAGLAVLVATAAQAQEMCTTPAGSVPPCMVGTWLGGSDMAARFDAMFAGLPEDIRAQAMESAGQNLFLRIEADGWYVTSALSADAEVTFLGESGASETLELALRTTGGTGFFTAGAGDALAFCAQTGGFGTASVGGAAVPVVPDGGMPVIPMRQSCAGDAMQMFVDLPPPMGTVTYDLTRIPEADIPPEVLAILPPR
jgi:hypothetical protein